MRNYLNISRRGSGFIVVLICMLLLSITFFSQQSGRVIDLLARQRKLLLKVRLGDRPEKNRTLTSREAIPALPEEVKLPEAPPSGASE